ncbi:hypothetical protein VCRLGP8_10075 [Vibrio crassostreae]|nr:hypothetical protein VCRLGP8_10075 [Vibrio crassostreae]CDT39942.1 hypothetical protein VCRLGP7_690075 [Vibrio crassostreae]
MTLGLRRVTVTNAACVPTFKIRIYYASGHVLALNSCLFCKLELQIARIHKNASDYVVINKLLKIHYPSQNCRISHRFNHFKQRLTSPRLFNINGY